MEKLFTEKELSKIKAVDRFDFNSLNQNGTKVIVADFSKNWEATITKVYFMKLNSQRNYCNAVDVFVTSCEKYNSDKSEIVVRENLMNNKVTINTRGINIGVVDKLKNDYVANNGAFYSGDMACSNIVDIEPNSMDFSEAVLNMKNSIINEKFRVSKELCPDIIDGLSQITYKIEDSGILVMNPKRSEIINELLISYLEFSRQ